MNTKRIVSALLAVLLLGSILVPAASAATATQDTERADLDITQPEYIDSSVDVEQSGGQTIYKVRGPKHELQLQGTNHSNVTSFGIQDGAGSLTYDAQRDVYVFDSEAKNLTTQLYWTVDNGDRTVRKTATIQVSDASWVHRPAAEDKQIQSELSTWRDVKRQVASTAPNQDVAAVIDQALGYYKFFTSPFSSVQRDMFATLVMFTRPGGLMILGLIVGIPTILVTLTWRYVNRTQKQFADIQDIRTEKDEAWLQKAKRILQQNDWNDLVPDDVARAMRDMFGRNVWQGFKSYMLMRSPSHTKALTLQAMGQTDYTGYVERDADGNVLGARAIHETDVKRDEDGEIVAVPGVGGLDPVTQGTADTLNELNLVELDADNKEDHTIVDEIPGTDLDEDVFERSDLDPAEISFPIDNREVSDAELLDELNPDFPQDFKDEEHMARTLGKMLQFVENHEFYTDDEGNVNGEMDLLSFMSELDTVLNDEADFPVVHINRKALFWIADNMDKEQQLEEKIDSIETDGLELSNEIDRSAQAGD
jgi:hypothetical protein